MTIAEALSEVRERIAAAAARAGRAPTEVRLIGASKTVAADRLLEALDAGLEDLGENRAQELLEKAPVLASHEPPPTWHFVGQLQRNKVTGLVPWVSCWHSVDRASLGEAIARRVPGARILVEVNLADEPRKGGCTPAGAPALVAGFRELGLDVAGLMTVAPQVGEPRRWFAALRDLAATLELHELSMGMSDDFEAAIEEGATMVRVGRAIFGARNG
ncbi:MAG: YggS family pyridoxal phosphate-dependent enzyme [Acidimicrobiia bacterium]